MATDAQGSDEQSAQSVQRGQRSKWTKARKADWDDRKGSKKQKQEWKVAVMVGYCGTGYHGMQLNPPHKTIEGELFDAFVKAGAISPYNADDPKKSGLIRAARTDKGVHAAGNVVSLKLVIDEAGEEATVENINKQLPDQIRVWGIEKTNKAFDCRKMCSSRVYEYLIPTYAFIAPKPGSFLAKQIIEQEKLNPGITRPDEESAKFWEKYEQLVKEANFTEEEMERIAEWKPTSVEEYESDYDTVRLVKKFKNIEYNAKREYRVSQEKLTVMRDAMAVYLGHHNFHNFTLGKHFKDPSAGRYMKEITVSDPFVIDQTEWCSIKIHGQSFMLHQIRKMIAMASLVTRTGCPVERITQCFNADKVNIPKAPALGLLLEQPVYSGYNQRLNDFGYNPLEFSKYEEKMQAFKMKHIYDKIYKEEVTENVFNAFYNFIDSYATEGVFDFLTAKGITKSADKEVDVPDKLTDAVDEKTEKKEEEKKGEKVEEKKDDKTSKFGSCTIC
ncbi:tRNA pseudouridine synthase 1 [Cyberlindnera fabianii]|uniref:tRNA pseudouridine synthase 1 n=1 Tax=Cyberlindnera fabianii TaxID=36022 RepID=A0A1V2L7B2_CYBFA|nr:tRNA pseudouridine synthase 1 [Cyberlindnera fabianii]